jgi:ketosteroid isomerase-like protein
MTVSEYPKWLQSFIDNYQALSVDNLDRLSDIYHDNVEFQDPAHHLVGFENLSRYFHELYTNLADCTFVINKVLVDGEQAAIYWQMTYVHPKLNKGKPVTVEGHSFIEGQDDKVRFHRDYVDLGAMLYEHIPLVGSAVKYVKTRMAS